MELKKNIFRLIIVGLSCVAMQKTTAQIFSDDFSDGELTTNPTWTGNTAQFLVNSNNELQLNDSGEGLSYISSEVNQTISEDLEWRFYMKQSFSGSANNNSRFYLMSNAADLSYTGTGVPSLEGYYLQFGESGSNDAIELFRNDAFGTSESIARGTEGFISGSFELTIKIVRSAAGEWEIWADANAGEEFELQDTGSDNSYQFIGSLGWVCKYTSSNSDNFYLDDLYVGAPILDTEPPLVSTVSVVSQNELSIEFNEPLDAVSAAVTSNYLVAGIGNPTSASVESPNEVLLTFSQNFTSGVENSIEISGVQDASGNEIVTVSLPFTYYDLSIPEPGDLIINEIFADPSPAVGLPDAEWIEIYNTSQNTFDLGQIQYYNSSTLNPIESYILPPNSYVVISDAAGASALEVYGDVAAASSFTALTNTSDSLTLVANGQVIDVVVYTDDWYLDDEKDDGGWSLERINPFTECSGADNWVASSSALGGTPSTENSQFSDVADVSPPEIESVSLLNASSIFIQASEILNEDTDVLVVSLDNGVGIATLNLIANETGILLTLDEPVELGVPFNLTVENLTDCEGNVNAFSLEFEVLSGFPAEAGDVLITEIMADPSPQVGLPEVEYIEVYNTTENYLDISDLDLDGATCVEQVILEPLAYKVLMSEDDISGNFIFSDAAPMDGWSSSFLTNSGKYLSLISNNQVLDELTYDISWYADPEKDNGGWSLERINLNDPCSDGSNWAASQSIFGGSPAEQNSIYTDLPDAEAPLLEFGYESEGNLILVFNEPLDASSVSESAFLVNGVEPSSVLVLDDYTISVALDSEPVAGQLFTVEINGIIDCWQNQVSGLEVEIGVSEPAEPGDIIINEVLSNPIGSGSDYLEIYNHSAKVISLEGWRVALRDEDGLVEQEKVIADFPVTLFPGQYLLLTENSEPVAETYPNAAQDRFWIMDLPSFNNDEGHIVLLMSDDEVSDELSYTSDFHFGLLDDTDGVALERVSFDIATQDENNWSSAASTENYGTPGYVNSQFQEIQGSSGTVSVFPEVFSPQGGVLTSNHLEISYEFEFNDASAKVSIYDKNGILVRDLVNNELIGSAGTFLWDGLDVNQQKLPVGIYVIYFEVFTLTGDVRSYKVPAVIGQI